MRIAKYWALAVVLLMIGASFIVLMGNSTGTRTEQTITTFKGGSSEETVVFNTQGFDNSIEIELPGSSRITNAELDILGSENTYDTILNMDHTNGANQACYGYLGDSASDYGPTTLLSGSKAYNNGDYLLVNSLDSSKFHIVNTAPDTNYYPFSMHSIRLTTLSFDSWTPFAYAYSYEPGKPLCMTNIQLHIYNRTSTSWEEVDSDYQTGVTYPPPTNSEVALGEEFTKDVSYYKNSTNDILLMLCPDDAYGGAMNNNMYVNYVSINLSTEVTSFPTDVKIDISDDGDFEYNTPGTFASTVFDNGSFTSELQEAVDGQTGMVTVKLNISSSSVGIFHLANLEIGVYENQAPTVVSSFNTLQFPEDGDGSGLLNLSTHFTDDNDETFRVEISQQGGTNIDAQVNGMEVDFSAPPNFYGSEEFNIKVYDTGLDAVYNTADDEFIESGWFTVIVTPTNDPPVLETMGGETITQETYQLSTNEDELFELEFTASDLDGDVVAFSSNSTLFSFDGATLKGTPEQDDVGVHYINITGTEDNSSALTDWVLLELTVLNTNDDPAISGFTPLGGYEVIYEPGETTLNVLEDSIGAWTINYDDMDMDICTFSTSFSNDRFDLEENGNFTFAPIQEDVGEHTVNFTINDGTVDNYAEITIKVKNVNDMPEVEPITFTGGVENLTVQFATTEAFDEDGDELTYKWDFGDGLTAQGLEAEHTYIMAGNYTVELEVTDGSKKNQTTIVIEVTEPIVEPPVVTDDDDEPNATDDDVEPPTNETDEDVEPPTNTTDDDAEQPSDDEPRDAKSSSFPWWILILIAVLLVVIVVIVLVVVMKRKKDDEEEGDTLPEPQAEPAGPMPVDAEPIQQQPQPEAYAQLQQDAYGQPQQDMYAQQQPAQDMYAQQQPAQDMYAQQQPAQMPAQPQYALPEAQVEQQNTGFKGPHQIPALEPHQETPAAAEADLFAPISEVQPPGQPEYTSVGCYNCGGDIPVTTNERPAILTCPNCGVQAQLDQT